MLHVDISVLDNMETRIWKMRREIIPFGYMKVAYIRLLVMRPRGWGERNDQGIAFNSSLCLKYFFANSSPPTAESSIQ